MKKILMSLSIVLLMLPLNISAKASFDERVVAHYLDVSYSLTYGKPHNSLDDQKDGIKYAKKALSWMEKYKMDMNGELAAYVYYRLALAYSPGKLKEEYKEMTSKYARKAYKIYKTKIGLQHPQASELRSSLKFWVGAGTAEEAIDILSKY